MSKNDNQWGDKLTTQHEFLKTSALETGQSIEGTVLAFRASTKFPESAPSIVMKLTNGETKNVTPSGNLKYAIRDGLLKVGNTYKIEKEGTKKIKGMTSGVFGIYPAKTNPDDNAQSSSEGI